METQDSCNADNSGRSRTLLVLNNSHKMNKQTKQCQHCSTTERTKEQNQLNDSSTTERLSDKHVLIESNNSYVMVSLATTERLSDNVLIELDNSYVVVSLAKLTDAHYKELAKLMNSVCDGLATSIPDYSDKFNEIKQTVKSTIEIYNKQSEELEQANKVVQLQYKELTDMLEGLPLPHPPLNIDIDEILKDMQFQECDGPDSPDKLKKAIKRISRPTAPRPRHTVLSLLKCPIQ